jgi:hypothetical protein
MALTIPSYPIRFDPANPISNAYAWLAGVYLDLSSNSGRVVLNVHPNAASWQSPPVDQVAVALGQVFGGPGATSGPDPGLPAVRFPTLGELMADPGPVGDTGISFAQAYAVIGLKLYAELAARVPALAGAREVA